MQSSAESYKHYGLHHGTALLLDSSKPDRDTFLAYMEARLPEHGREAYMDGVMDGLMGEGKRGLRYLRGLVKHGSEDGKHRFSAVGEKGGGE